MRNEIELGAFRRSVKVSFTQASNASGVSRTRLAFSERGAARLSDAEREALERFYETTALRNLAELKRVFGGAGGTSDVGRN